MRIPENFDSYIHIAGGIFLVYDSLYIHAITFNYAKYGIAWLDPILSHGIIGLILVYFGAKRLRWIRWVQ